MVVSTDLTWSDPLSADTAVGTKSLQCFRARDVLQAVCTIQHSETHEKKLS